MPNIEKLIEGSRTSHYKLLTIVGNNKSRTEQIIEYLRNTGWKIYDIEEIVLKISEKIPENKIRLRIGTELKKWMKGIDKKAVFINCNILYSGIMNKTTPFNAFKYGMRGDREGILFLEAKLKGDKAVYSEPGRPDYNETELSEVLFIELEKVEIKE